MARTLGYAFADTPVGLIVVVATERGIVAVEWGDDEEGLRQTMHARFPDDELVPGAHAAARLASEVAALAADPLGAARDVPLDLHGTEFQRAVWEAMRAIPPGQTVSYSGLAAAIGHPKAYRAVAQACARNPLPIVVPCHRVIASGGGLGGFSGGLWRKKTLLEREGSLPRGASSAG